VSAALWSGSGTPAGSDIQQTHAGVRGFRWSVRKPKSVQRSGRESIVHSRTQFQPSIECPFPNPDPADRLFPNPDPAGNPPLSPFPCFVLAGRSPFSPVNLGSTGSSGQGHGRPVCWISDGVWVQPAGDWRGERVWNSDCRGGGHFYILTFIPCKKPRQFLY
jgi:hypothetical protein